MNKKRRNYPGDLRQVGTKDYGVILSFLINYRNRLLREKDEDIILNLFHKIAEKLQELGFKRESSKVKTKAKNTNRLQQKKEEVIQIAVEKWREAKDAHEKAKEELREQERELEKLKKQAEKEAKDKKH